MNVTNAAGGSSAVYKSWNAPIGTVHGRFLHGFGTTMPTTSIACNYGDIVSSTTPGSGSPVQPVNGWYCITPSSSTWTGF